MMDSIQTRPRTTLTDSDITFSLIGISEIELVQKILSRAPQYWLNVEGTTEIPDLANREIKRLPPDCSPEQNYFMLVTYNAQHIGLVRLLKDYPTIGTAYLSLLLLDETLQGQGFGKRVYQSLEALIVNDFKSSKIRLGIVENNPVEPFWVKMGFARTGEEKPHRGLYLKSTNYSMEKDLSPI
jgi:hypothetical protein